MGTFSWNPWYGCKKKSEGCLNCYVYRHDARYGGDASTIYKVKDFDMPIRKNRKGEYKIPSRSIIWTCFTSDFFLEEADEWRRDAWKIIRERKDCSFVFLTKRIERFYKGLPIDWYEGWDNVTIGCSCENQARADERIPLLLSFPIKNRQIICAPLLGEIDLSSYLNNKINSVVVSGESGIEARICDYDWVLKIRDECFKKNITFFYKQTGSKFMKSGKIYKIKVRDQALQARKAKIDFKKE
jgi:protein gp37